MEKLELSSPWDIYCKEIRALFEEDPEVTVKYDDTIPEITLIVDNEEKAEALLILLPSEKEFGKTNLKITVIPSNARNHDMANLFRKAFDGNNAVSYIHTKDKGFMKDASYIVFKNKVVQYFTDDLCDINGNKSTLYQEIAKDVFGKTNGICFCTDISKKDKRNAAFTAAASKQE